LAAIHQAGLKRRKAWVTKRVTKHKTGGKLMAVNTSGGHPAMDYAEHVRTYSSFLAWTKVGIIFLVVLLSGMAYFLV
jgi:hypothetical protein